MSIHVPTNDQNVFGNVLDKGRLITVEDDNIITGNGWTVARDECCAGVGLDWSLHHSCKGSHFAIQQF